MERMRGRGGVYGGGLFFSFQGEELNDEKNYKIKYEKGLRWPPLNIFSLNNQPKTCGRDGGGLG